MLSVTYHSSGDVVKFGKSGSGRAARRARGCLDHEDAETHEGHGARSPRRKLAPAGACALRDLRASRASPPSSLRDPPPHTDLLCKGALFWGWVAGPCLGIALRAADQRVPGRLGPCGGGVGAHGGAWHPAPGTWVEPSSNFQRKDRIMTHPQVLGAVTDGLRVPSATRNLPSLACWFPERTRPIPCSNHDLERR